MEFDESPAAFSIKDEPDSDPESLSSNGGRWSEKPIWTSQLTMKLIEAYKNDCTELWDTKQRSNRVVRDVKLEYLAGMFHTTTDEICRKIHNLRTQFNCQLRKIKRQRASVVPGEGDVVVGWEYFDALSFLLPSSGDPPDVSEGLNLELAEFQAKEEVEFGAAARANIQQISSQQTPGPSTRPRSTTPGTSEAAPSISRRPSGSRMAAPPLPPLPPSAYPILPEPDPLLRTRHGVSGDECQIFGDFVASELRTLRSDESRKKLKRMIQKAILQVGEEEDVNMISTG